MNGRSLLERRVIALGLLVLILCLIGFGVGMPIAAGFADRAVQRVQLTDDLQRGRTLVAQRQLWRLQAQRQGADAAQFAVVAPNASAAAAVVTDRISAAIQSPGGALTSLREQPSVPGEARIRVEGRLTLTQLVASLKVLEGQRPFILVDGLSIAADPTAAAGQLTPMDVRIDLSVPFQVVVG